MKYKTKITPAENGYVGYVILNEETVFTTNVHNDTVMVSRELSSYIAKAIEEGAPTPSHSSVVNASSETPIANNVVPVSSNQTLTPRQVFIPLTPAPRKCCGRQ